MSRTWKDTKAGKAKKAKRINSLGCFIGGISSQYKRLRKRERKAKDKAAIIQGKEPIHWRKSDEDDWW